MDIARIFGKIIHKICLLRRVQFRLLLANRVKSDHNNKDIIKSTTTSYKHSGASLESEDEDLFFLHIGDERLVVMTLSQ